MIGLTISNGIISEKFIRFVSYGTLHYMHPNVIEFGIHVYIHVYLVINPCLQTHNMLHASTRTTDCGKRNPLSHYCNQLCGVISKHMDTQCKQISEPVRCTTI